MFEKVLSWENGRGIIIMSVLIGALIGSEKFLKNFLSWENGRGIVLTSFIIGTLICLLMWKLKCAKWTLFIPAICTAYLIALGSIIIFQPNLLEEYSFWGEDKILLPTAVFIGCEVYLIIWNLAEDTKYGKRRFLRFFLPALFCMLCMLINILIALVLLVSNIHFFFLGIFIYAYYATKVSGVLGIVLLVLKQFGISFKYFSK